jgi:hypothetical protein
MTLSLAYQLECVRQPDGNALAMADEAGGVAVWQGPVPQDYIGPADNPDAAHAALSALETLSAGVAEDPAAHGDSLDNSLGEPGKPWPGTETPIPALQNTV